MTVDEAELAAWKAEVVGELRGIADDMQKRMDALERQDTILLRLDMVKRDIEMMLIELGQGGRQCHDEVLSLLGKARWGLNAIIERQMMFHTPTNSDENHHIWETIVSSLNFLKFYAGAETSKVSYRARITLNSVDFDSVLNWIEKTPGVRK